MKLSGIRFLPSGGALLENAGAEFVQVENNGTMLRRVIEQIDADYVIVDTPPTLGFMFTVSIAAADFIIIPTKPFALDFAGLAELRTSISLIGKDLNPKLKILGILITQLDARTPTYFTNVEALNNFFPGFLFASMIPLNVAVDASFRAKKALVEFDQGSAAGAEYLKLVAEVEERISQIGGK